MNQKITTRCFVGPDAVTCTPELRLPESRLVVVCSGPNLAVSGGGDAETLSGQAEERIRQRFQGPVETAASVTLDYYDGASHGCLAFDVGRREVVRRPDGSFLWLQLSDRRRRRPRLRRPTPENPVMSVEDAERFAGIAMQRMQDLRDNLPTPASGGSSRPTGNGPALPQKEMDHVRTVGKRG